MKLPSPLYGDPIHDGPTDPLVIRNPFENSWWMIYTQRRASSPVTEAGHGWVHGTDLGIASSTDEGNLWTYRGTLDLEPFEPGRNTYWAPEIIHHDGIWHMYVSFVRGVPTDWVGRRAVVHYTSLNLWTWTLVGQIELSSHRIIDAAVVRVGEHWQMYYKDEDHDSQTWRATSTDLSHWEVDGPVITDRPHEGPAVFQAGGFWWMVTDPWNGLGVYRSVDTCHWEFQGLILDQPGTRPMDNHIAHHASVLKVGPRLLLFYFVHPNQDVREEVPGSGCHLWRRSVIQVAELRVRDGVLSCDRNDSPLLLGPARV